jgi:hypothetical protein
MDFKYLNMDFDKLWDYALCLKTYILAFEESEEYFEFSKWWQNHCGGVWFAEECELEKQKNTNSENIVIMIMRFDDYSSIELMTSGGLQQLSWEIDDKGLLEEAYSFFPEGCDELLKVMLRFYANMINYEPTECRRIIEKLIIKGKS